MRLKSNANRMAELIDNFGGACIDCGADGSTSGRLEFHHRDPSTKEFNVGRNSDRSMKALEEEAFKCDLICRACHEKRHSIIDGRKRGHGTYTSYQYGCRCSECANANYTYKRNNYLEKRK